MMVRAHHLIFTAYGFWLPNDPRGSWSDWVRRWELLRFGKATKATTRRSVAGRPHDVQLRQAIRYVEHNPLKEDKRRQHWSFVVPFTPSPSRQCPA